MDFFKMNSLEKSLSVAFNLVYQNSRLGDLKSLQAT